MSSIFPRLPVAELGVDEQPNSALIHGLKLEVLRLEAENASLRGEIARFYVRASVNCQEKSS